MAVVLLLLAGCGSGSGSDSTTATDAGAAAGPAHEGGNAAPEERQGGTGAATDTRVDQRSIIYTGSLQVKVDDVAAAARRAAATATRAGGFVGADQRRSSDADAVAELQLRVPADRFYAVVEELADLGVQQQREINTQDVTEESIDLDARITSQRARVESARRLLERASSISDLVTLENELGRREADLASLEAKKRRLTDLTALSAVTVTLVGPDASIAEEKNEIGFLVGLRGGWKVFLTSMTVLLTVLGAVLPWLLVLGVPLGVLWWLRRRHGKRRPEATPVAPLVTTPPPAAAPPPEGGAPTPVPHTRSSS
ncbi:lipoprotein [Micromonospora qiuiae]|uniref:Lipoprotein n=1 Tax=Micromonospora qiuiae TaxID=502268 RepID=A0ABQ4J6Y1_9ACTN|nr:lipoprotein [Micromonospora qiuiae]